MHAATAAIIDTARGIA